MRTIVQVEYRSGLLTVREEILQFLGHPVVSVFGSQAARRLDLSDKDVGVVLIGHGAAWEERSQLIAHFKQTLPGIPVIASLRRSDEPFCHADFNCPADNPPDGYVRSDKHSPESIELAPSLCCGSPRCHPKVNRRALGDKLGTRKIVDRHSSLLAVGGSSH